MAEEEDNTGIATVSFTEEPEMEVYGEVRIDLFLFSFRKCTLVDFFSTTLFFSPSQNSFSYSYSK